MRCVCSWAASNGHSECVYTLLQSKAHLEDKCTQRGQTALLWASADVSQPPVLFVAVRAVQRLESAVCGCSAAGVCCLWLSGLFSSWCLIVWLTGPCCCSEVAARCRRRCGQAERLWQHSAEYSSCAGLHAGGSISNDCRRLAHSLAHCITHSVAASLTCCLTHSLAASLLLLATPPHPFPCSYLVLPQ